MKLYLCHRISDSSIDEQIRLHEEYQKLHREFLEAPIDDPIGKKHNTEHSYASARALQFFDCLLKEVKYYREQIYERNKLIAHRDELISEAEVINAQLAGRSE